MGGIIGVFDFKNGWAACYAMYPTDVRPEVIIRNDGAV